MLPIQVVQLPTAVCPELMNILALTRRPVFWLIQIVFITFCRLLLFVLIFAYKILSVNIIFCINNSNLICYHNDSLRRPMLQITK